MAPLNQADLLLNTETDDNDQYITTFKAKIAYQKQLFITYLNSQMTFEDFQKEVREVCCISLESPFTIKWIDGDGDPCTISTQLELTETFRLCNLNKSEELSLHTFLGAPVLPGMACYGETLDMYRKGARRWKKTYKIKGHTFVAKRLHRKSYCGYCENRIYGFGRKGLRCSACRYLIHKKCNRLVATYCNPQFLSTSPYSSSTCQNINANDEDSDLDVAPESSLHNYKANSISIIGTIDIETQETQANSGQQKKIVIEKEKEESLIGIKRSISIQDFNLIGVIGRGNYSKVILARMKATKQRYALKILKKELLLEDKDLESIQTEKSVLKMSTNHPFLVQLYSCFQTASHLFYVIEFVPGGDLMYLMQKSGILCEDYARFYAAEISLAIRFLHENGVIYRDLKLDNVLLAQDGHIKLTDYGMCKQNLKEDENASTFCGTPNYMAPEIVNNEKYSYSVDWWALGVLLYEMMTGHSPFRPDDISEDVLTEEDMFRNILTKALKPPRNLSLRAAKVIRDFLNRDPESRLGSKRTGSFKEITDHLFFASIDWEALKLKQVKPPLLPKIISEQDLTNFPNEFTNQSLTLTPDKISAIDKVDGSEFHEFQGFEYINPVLVRMDDTDHI